MKLSPSSCMSRRVNKHITHATARFHDKACQVWVASAAVCSLLGGSSIFGGFLNKWLYLGLMILLGMGAWGWMRPVSWKTEFLRWVNRLRRDCGALVFHVLAFFVALGALIYAPSNYDGLAYRIPRILSWLSDERWSWLATANSRMNFQGCGWEWLAAPHFALLGTDRLLWLINFIPFLLLPGVVFRVSRLLGIGGRAARRWMWLLPLGTGFVLQAGSIGSDLLGAFYFLLAWMWALDFRRQGAWLSGSFSLLAIGLMTGVKATTLPLGLPWLFAWIPGLLLMGKRSMRTIWLMLPIAVAALCCSWITTAWLNYRHCGDPFGEVLMSGAVRKATDPLVGLAGNALLLTVQNAVPPVLPAAGVLEGKIRNLLPAVWNVALEANFENKFDLGLGELQIEESAGLGIGVLAALFVASGAGFMNRRRSFKPAFSSVTVTAALGVLGAVAAFMMKSGMTTAARLFLPYAMPVALLAVLWLVPYRKNRRLDAVLITLAGLTAFSAVILTPARPLWPVQSVFNLCRVSLEGSQAFQRAQRVYEVYRQRPWVLTELGADLPVGSRLGLVGTGDDASASLWKPYGTRRIVELRQDEVESAIHHLDYVVVMDGHLDADGGRIRHILQKHNAQIVRSMQATFKVQAGPRLWSLYSLPSNPEAGLIR